MTWIDDTCDSLERYFVANADPERAEPMASYMRDQFAFYGIGAKDRGDILKAVWAEHALPTEAAELADFVDACLTRPQREWHYTAVAAMRKQARHLRGDSWDTVHTIATSHAWWDTIDELAKHVAGRIVKNDPAEVVVMDDWVRSDDMWVARVAILHQLGYKATTDTDRLFGYCRLRAEETDFFYRKAIGWALRQYAYEDADAVRCFVADHEAVLSPLSVREALKNIGSGDR